MTDMYDLYVANVFAADVADEVPAENVEELPADAKPRGGTSAG